VSSHSHLELAEALAGRFTVFAPDRRGRGLSGPFGDGYSIRKEVEDLDALLTRTGAHDVFGVSAGAVIGLQAALTLPAIRKLAVFEPALVVDRSLSMAFVTRYDEEIAQGRVASALVTGMLGAQLGPPIFSFLPRWLLEKLTTMFMASEEKKAAGDSPSMRMLAPTLHYDFQLIIEMEEALETFRAIRADVLLLGGSKSPTYLKIAAAAVEKVLPHLTRVEFSGLDHGASGPSDRGGRPQLVAEKLGEFFV
jgi:pimeloyl-ACP methyl ester carboxylesterase